MDCENVEKYKEQYLQYAQYSNNFAYRHLLNKAKKLVNNIYKIKYEEKYFILDNSENFFLQIKKEDIAGIIANQLNISRD